MKINTILILCFSNLLYSSFSLRLNTEPLPVESEAYAYNDGRKGQGITYGLGSSRGYSVSQDSSFKKVTTVKDLVQFKAERVQTADPNSKVVASELPSTAVFYDGERNLNTIRIECRFIVNEDTCFKSPYCGWCENPKRCVDGSINGPTPLEECPRSMYQFSNPTGIQRSQHVNIDGIDLRIESDLHK